MQQPAFRSISEGNRILEESSLRPCRRLYIRCSASCSCQDTEVSSVSIGGRTDGENAACTCGHRDP